MKNNIINKRTTKYTSYPNSSSSAVNITISSSMARTASVSISSYG